MTQESETYPDAGESSAAPLESGGAELAKVEGGLLGPTAETDSFAFLDDGVDVRMNEIVATGTATIEAARALTDGAAISQITQKAGKVAVAAGLAATLAVPATSALDNVELPQVVPIVQIVQTPPQPDHATVVDDQDAGDHAAKRSFKILKIILAVILAFALVAFGVVKCAAIFAGEAVDPLITELVDEDGDDDGQARG